MIIAFAGPKGVGKSTLASYVEKKYNFTRNSLAQPLKQICSLYFGIPLEDFYDENTKEVVNDNVNYSPRQIMQIFGTDIVRNNEIDKFFPKMPKHTSRWIYLMEQFCKKHSNIVIDDVRFQDELDALKKLGATIILVSRQTQSQQDNHSSETQQLSNYDYLIDNSVELNEVEAVIDKIIQRHFK